MWSSRMEGPCLEMMETWKTRKTRTRGGDSTDQTSQPNLRNLNFTNTLYPLAYYQVLLQHLNIIYRIL